MNAHSKRVRILCVDDHPIVRQGIAGLVGVQSDMELIGEADAGFYVLLATLAAALALLGPGAWSVDGPSYDSHFYSAPKRDV